MHIQLFTQNPADLPELTPTYETRIRATAQADHIQQLITQMPCQPVGFRCGVPIYSGAMARKELQRRFGVPNAITFDLTILFSGHDIPGLFVDDHQNGIPMAFLINENQP